MKKVSVWNHDTMDGELTEIYYTTLDLKLYVYRFEVTHNGVTFKDAADFMNLDLNIDHNLLLTGRAQVKRFIVETNFTNVLDFDVSPNNLILNVDKRGIICGSMYCQETSPISLTISVRKIILCYMGMAILDEKNNLYICEYQQGHNYFTHPIKYEKPRLIKSNVLDVIFGSNEYVIQQF